MRPPRGESSSCSSIVPRRGRIAGNKVVRSSVRPQTSVNEARIRSEKLIHSTWSDCTSRRRMRHLRAITAQLLPRRFFPRSRPPSSSLSLSRSLARSFFRITLRNYSLIKRRVQTALIDCRKLMRSARGSLTRSNIAGSIAVIIPLPVYNPSVLSPGILIH